jgi:nitrous oxidase accessory protein NosD
MPGRTFATTAAMTFAACLVAAGVAAAPAQRTFVASNGNDANPCSIAAPCRAFTAALAQTLSGGEVIVLDSAGYGPVTISQSVSIIAPPGVYAGISVPASGNATGVLIATAGVNVVLRGLTINNTGGTYGIHLTNGAGLVIENCVISNFDTGVWIQAPARVSITGSTVRDSMAGIVAGFGATVNVSNSQVLANASEGIEIYGGSGGVTTRVHVSDSLVTGRGPSGSAYCIDNFAVVGTVGHISASRVTVTGCAFAVSNEPAGSGTLTIGYSTIAGNGTAFDSLGTSFFTLGNNQLGNNTFDASGTIITIGGK